MSRHPLARSGPIVLIDDDETLCRLYGQAIEARGQAVLTATRAGEGLALVLDTKPWALLLDVSLRDSSGIELCARLRRLCAEPVTVLFLTAHETLRVIHDGLLAGGDDFLVKGVGFDALMARLAFWRQSALPVLPPRARNSALAAVERRLLAPGGEAASIAAIPGLDRAIGRVIASQLRYALSYCGGVSFRGPNNQTLLLGYLAGVVEDVTGRHLDAALRFADYFDAAVAGLGVLKRRPAGKVLGDLVPDFADKAFAAATRAGRADARRFGHGNIDCSGLAGLYAKED